MIEETVITYLENAIDPPVYAEMPENPVLPVVLVQKTGGGRRNYVYDAIIAIQSYGSTLYEAATTNEAVKSAMDGLLSLPEIGSVELNSDYEFTDYSQQAALGRYRYQAVYQLVHY